MVGQRIGYIGVSTIDQKDTKRPQLDLLMSYARGGDTVVVHSMDRLARNLDDLRRIVHTLSGKGVKVEFVKEHLTFTGDDSPMGGLLLSVMGAFAEFERALIKERQREGIASAKKRGAYRGRKRHHRGAQKAHKQGTAWRFSARFGVTLGAPYLWWMSPDDAWRYSA
jgi:DNA invertase Pin-like site-specific DNA recombinase